MCLLLTVQTIWLCCSNFCAYSSNCLAMLFPDCGIFAVNFWKVLWRFIGNMKMLPFVILCHLFLYKVFFQRIFQWLKHFTKSSDITSLQNWCIHVQLGFGWLTDMNWTLPHIISILVKYSKIDFEACRLFMVDQIIEMRILPASKKETMQCNKMIATLTKFSSEVLKIWKMQ